jgi:hypothetical protein
MKTLTQTLKIAISNHFGTSDYRDYKRSLFLQGKKSERL